MCGHFRGIPAGDRFRERSLCETSCRCEKWNGYFVETFEASLRNERWISSSLDAYKSKILRIWAESNGT